MARMHPEEHRALGDGCCRRGVEHANVRTVCPSTLAGETSEPCPALVFACLGPVCTSTPAMGEARA